MRTTVEDIRTAMARNDYGVNPNYSLRRIIHDFQEVTYFHVADKLNGPLQGVNKSNEIFKSALHIDAQIYTDQGAQVLLNIKFCFDSELLSMAEVSYLTFTCAGSRELSHNERLEIGSMTPVQIGKTVSEKLVYFMRANALKANSVLHLVEEM